MKVPTKHAVNGNPTVPPFQDNMELAMFGEYIQNCKSLSYPGFEEEWGGWEYTGLSLSVHPSVHPSGTSIFLSNRNSHPLQT